jgi:multicomponent Na+:H+ antiporter subunit A
MAIPSALLGIGSLAGFVALGWVTGVVRPAAVQINPAAGVYELLRWPGLTDAFLVSMGIVAGGVVLGVLLARQVSRVPEPLGATFVDQLTDGVLVVARRVTGRIQHGSLPVYVATMALTAGLAGIPFAFAVDVGSLSWWDSAEQGVLAILVVAAASTAAVVGSRLGAALGLGAVGIGVAGLFVTQGAPDLALTQLLVETVVVVGFVVGLGHLARRFPPVGHVWRGIRIAVSATLGIAVAVALAASGSAPTGAPPAATLAEQAVDEGGGNNIVNVILTDVRALDTLGEVVVLVVVAIGILALARPRQADDEAVAEPIA